MDTPVEKSNQKYRYEIFMKRTHGPEKYYQIDREKSIRENLVGKVIIEFPEFILTPTDLATPFFQKETQEVDFKKGQKAMRPPFITASRPGFY